MLRLQQKLLCFGIVSPTITHSSRHMRKDPKLNLYPIFGLEDLKLGTLTLNQPNNQNFMTSEMMDQMYRFFDSYQHDHSVENVWIQNRGSMFLGGLSFRQLYSDPEYLSQLYRTTHMIANLNKPIFALANGGVRNVGAYVLSMAAISMTEGSASLRIDEVSKGFIPVGSGSHRLSRLPAKMGHYLALTGRKLSALEMSRLGLITAVAKQGVTSKEMRSNISRSNLFFRDRVRLAYNDIRNQEFQEWHRILKKKKNYKNELEISQSEIIGQGQNVFAKLAANQYKVAQVDYQNVVTPFNSFTPKHGRTINNYFQLRHQKAFAFLEKHELVETSQYDNLRLPGIPIDKVLKVFGQCSLKEAIKVLQEDNSEWGQESARKLREMDPLAALLTFQLLNRAEGLSWDQCIKLQFTVAQRLLAISELTLKETYSGSKYVLTNKYSGLKIEDVPNEEILNFFRHAQTFEQTLDLEVQQYSLSPSLDFRDIPDSARLAMNQTFFNDEHLVNQQQELKRYLQAERVDYRHRSYDVHALRQKVHQKKEVQLLTTLEKKRLQLLVNNGKFMQNFLREKYDYVDNIQQQEFATIIDRIAKKVFNEGINKRFTDLQATADNIGKEKKLQLFKSMRKTLLKSIVLKGKDIEQKHMQNAETFSGLVYFDPNGGNVLETKNPYVKSMANLNQLSKQLQNRELSEDYTQSKGVESVDSNIGFNRFVDKRQQIKQKVYKDIARRYYEDPYAWEKSFEYQELVSRAAETSEELAQYLEWTNNQFYTMILNAPASERNYNQLGEKYLKRMEEDRKLEQEVLTENLTIAKNLTQSYFSELYKNQKSKQKSFHMIKEAILPKKYIPVVFQKCLQGTFEQILGHFQVKYFQEAALEKKNDLGDFDKYVYQRIDEQFVRKYKNDVLFVFSYFAILRIKEVLRSLQQKGGVQGVENLHTFFRQYKIQFPEDADIKKINRLLSNFLFFLLDTHTYTKAKVVLPQSKLLDFLNRVKVSRETSPKSPYPLSFQSLLLTIGKDRSRAYNKLLGEYIPTQPQFLLDAATQANKDQTYNEQFWRKCTNSIAYMYENAYPQKSKELVRGYVYYLMLLDSFVQRASGKYNFLSEQMLGQDPTKTRQTLSKILNPAESSQDWVERTAKKLIQNFFQVRLSFEKELTQGELLAFDQEMRELMTPETFKVLLKKQLDYDVAATKELFKKTRQYEFPDQKYNKSQQIYCTLRRKVRNPDAFKRLNNLKMAMNIQRDYFINAASKIVSKEEQEDLVDVQREFGQHERFPKETYRRMLKESFSYGEEKNFDEVLNPLAQKQISNHPTIQSLRFTQQGFKEEKKMVFSEFSEQLKELGDILVKKKKQEDIGGLYSRIQELL